MSKCPDFVLSRAPQIPRQKYTSEHHILQNSFQWLLSNFSYFLKKGIKQKQFFIPPLCLMRLKSCNCIKIVKIASIHNFEKKYSNLSSVSFKFCIIKHRSRHERCFIKKENTCARVSFLRTFFTEHLWTTASQNTKTTLLTFHVMLTFSFTNIHESQDCRGRGRAFL